MSICALGDIHLEGLRNIIPGGGLDYQFEALDSVMVEAKRLGCTEVWQAGDLFDTAFPDDATKVRLSKLILQHGLRWRAIPGNHDRPLTERHSMKMLSWLGEQNFLHLDIYLKPELIETDVGPIWFCPHPFTDPCPEPCRLQFGHFPWTGARRDNGSKHEKGHRPKGTWLLGDFHTAQEGKDFEYLGSVTQVEWTEKPKKFWTHLTSKGDRLVRKRIPVKLPYTLNELVIERNRDLKAISKNPDDYYRLILHPGVTLPDDWQARWPNVLRRSPVTIKKEKRDATSVLSLSDDPLDGFEDYLKERGNLSETQIAWALKQLQNLKGKEQ